MKNILEKQLFKNVTIDKETGLLIGLEYDHYIKSVKNRKSE